jgi:hypothetical protein
MQSIVTAVTTAGITNAGIGHLGEHAGDQYLCAYNGLLDVWCQMWSQSTTLVTPCKAGFFTHVGLSSSSSDVTLATQAFQAQLTTVVSWLG